MGEDGKAATVRADIQMRVVIDSESYTDIGRVMDAINDAMRTVLLGRERAHFDFTGFQTHPCKAIEMDERVYDGRLAQPTYYAQDVAQDVPG